MAGDAPYGSLGGKPLISCRKTILQFMEKGWDYSSFYRRANSYTCSLGAEPGLAYVLMRQEDLKSLDSRQPQDLILGLAQKSVTIKKLAIIQAQSLLPFSSSNPNSLYLVTLADVRYFLKRTTINSRYNIRESCADSAFCTNTTYNDTGTAYTFLQIVADIWTKFSSFGGFFDYSTFVSTYVHSTANLPTENPENLRFEGMSAWDALQQLCQLCGFLLRYNPLVGDVTLLKIGLSGDPYAAADGDFHAGFGGGRDGITGSVTKFSLTPNSLPRSTGDGLLEDAEMILGSPLIPESVNVIFPTNDTECTSSCAIDGSHGWYFTKNVLATRVKELFDDELADPAIGLTNYPYAYMDQAIAGTSVNINSTFTAQFDVATDTTATNDAELITVAEQMAVDYYRTLGYQANGRIVCRGIKQVIPGPTISEVAWREWGDGLKTEVARWPVPVGSPRPGKVFTGNGSVLQRVHFSIDSYDDGTGVATCNVEYRPCGIEVVIGEAYGQIEVIDPAGCYFDEDAYDLVGRWGHADLMVADGDSYNECVWVVSGLCCPT